VEIGGKEEEVCAREHRYDEWEKVWQTSGRWEYHDGETQEQLAHTRDAELKQWRIIKRNANLKMILAFLVCIKPCYPGYCFMITKYSTILHF